MGHSPDQLSDLAHPHASSDGKCCSQFADLAALHKALSHPGRLMILFALSKGHKSCCGDICSVLPLAQSTVSQHLKVLRDAGLIELDVDGLRSHYRLNREKIQWLHETSGAFIAGLDAQSCGD